jgi:hypothetical protein
VAKNIGFYSWDTGTTKRLPLILTRICVRGCRRSVSSQFLRLERHFLHYIAELTANMSDREG